MKFKFTLLILVFLQSFYITADMSQPDNNSQVFTLKQAIQLTLQLNPGIKQASKDVTISKFREKEASLFYNPEFEVEVENFGGSGSFSGFDDSELNIKLSQQFELWGKRTLKKKIALLEKDITELDLLKSKSKSVYETAKHYYQCSLLAEHLKIARKSEQVHKKNLDLISEQVIAGKKPVSDQRRYQIEYNKSIISRKSIETEFKNSLFILFNQWGSMPSEKPIQFLVDTPDKIESLAYFLDGLDNNLELRIHTKKLNVLNEEFNLEKKRSRPDLSVTGGLRKFRGNNETAYIFGVGVEIPVFNKHKLGQEIKKVKTEQSKLFIDHLEMRVKADIESTYNNLAQCFYEINMLKSTMIPLTDIEIESQQLSYTEGKSSILEILSTTLTAYNIKQELAEKIFKYRVLESKLQYLTGKIIQ